MADLVSLVSGLALGLAFGYLIAWAHRKEMTSDRNPEDAHKRAQIRIAQLKKSLARAEAETRKHEQARKEAEMRSEEARFRGPEWR